jgi:probable rRNA maturation factor
VPRSGAAAPSGKWRRAALPWAERLPTPATLNRFLREAQQAVRLCGEVSVLLTTDAAIRKLNRDFRGKNKATDVLSFPAAPIPAGQRVSKSASQRVCGDLAISVDTARKQAAEQGHALTCELKILMLHGLLHLAGYDHEADDGKMADREGLLRARFGLQLGLIERAEESRVSGASGVRKSASQQVGKSAPPNPLHKKRGEGGALFEQAGPKRRPTAGSSRREATKIAQGGVRESGRNPGKAPESRARRPVGPARKSASPNHRSPKP